MKQQPKNIAAVLQGVLQQARERHGALFEIQQQWPQIVGRKLAAHTRPVSLRQGKLVVHTDRPADNYLFSFSRQQATARVGQLTQGKVNEIVVRAGMLGR